MIIRLSLTPENGGEKDPLDIIISGPAIPRGHTAPIRIIGMLELLEQGKQADKLIRRFWRHLVRQGS